MKRRILGTLIVLILGRTALGIDPYVSEPTFFATPPPRVMDQEVPKDAVGYQIYTHSKEIQWLTPDTWTVPVLWFDGTPRISALNKLLKNKIAPPKGALGYRIAIRAGSPYSLELKWIEGEFFRESAPEFVKDKGTALFAYLNLVDEVIGPQLIESPDTDVPQLSPDLSKTILKSRFSTIKSLFDSAEKPSPERIKPKEMWGGRCVFRVAPDTEVGAALGFSNEAGDNKAAVYISAEGAEVESNLVVTPPKTFPQYSPEQIQQLFARFRQENQNWTTLKETPEGKRPLLANALFFDVFRGDAAPSFSRGYRLKTYVTPSNNPVYLVEGYAFLEGRGHAGRILKYLEPIVYCLFDKPRSERR